MSSPTESVQTLADELLSLRQRVADLECEQAQRQLDRDPVTHSSDQHYRFLYEHNLSMYFTLSPDGTVLSVNRYGADQLGYAQEELVNRSVLMVFDPSDHHTVRGQLTTCTNNPSQTFEWEIGKVRKNGSPLWVKERARAMTDTTGRVIILVVCEDVTEQHRAQILQKQTEESLRELSLALSNAMPGISRLDNEGCYLSVNDYYATQLGYTPSELSGQPWQPTLHPDDLSIAEHAYQQLGMAGKAEFEARGLRKDGTVFHKHVLMVRIADASGHMIGHHCFMRNISRRKQAEVALRESEQRLQRFFNEAPVGLAILDGDKRFLSVNKAYCALTGYDEADIIGLTYAHYTHPEDLSDNLALTDQFYRGDRSEYAIEKRYIRKSGETIWVSVNATGFELPNHPGPLLLAAIQDITDRKRVEEQRERLSQDLHDNLLQSLYAVGMQLEASKLAAGSSPKQSKIHVTQAIDQLNRMVEDVRHFIALLKHRTVATPDFGQALRQLVASLSFTNQAAPQLEIHESVTALLTPEQAGHLLNIAREALSNSLRHAHATRRWVRLDHTGDAIRMEIGDDGAGFTPKGGRQRGHGLCNMADRAKKIGARFRIESAPGKGTCIAVCLPTASRNGHA